MKVRRLRFPTKGAALAAFRVARLSGSVRPLRQDLTFGRLILPGSKILASPIPKVASTTINAAMFEIGPNAECREIIIHPHDIRKQYPDFFVFSFVRNPWDRVYSCWKDKISDSYSLGKIGILSRYDGIAPFMPFEAFVEWLCSPAGRDEVADRHWMSQSAHLSDDSGAIYCDFVGKIESLEADFAALGERLGLAFPTPGHANLKAAAASYRDAYTRATRAKIAERYARDIETFAYTFD